jgi:hypothetical protein
MDGVRMRNAGLELELAITHDLCLTRRWSYWSAWSGGRRFNVEQKLAVLAEATAPGANISEVARRHGLLPAQVYKWRRLAELGVIGVPGAWVLPSFVAVEITKDFPSLPAPVVEGKPAAIDGAPPHRRRKKAGRIGVGFALIAISTRRCWSGFSTCWRDDDPGSKRGAGVAGSWTDRPAQRHERTGTAGPAGAGA